MDLASRLLLLLEVVDAGSFVKVSEQRNVDRSVISKQITKLEEELGVRLLNRTTRSLSLTAAGSEMINQAKRLRDLLNNTHRLAQTYHSEPRGTLKITSSSLFGRQYIQKAILEFQRRYTDVEVELRLEDRVVEMVGEGFDIGFRLGVPKDSSLISTKIARNRMLIVASPAFIERYGAPQSIEELEQLPAVVYSSTGLLIDKIKYLDEDGEDAHIQLNTAYKANEAEILTSTALSGNMIAAVTAQMIDDEILTGKLVPIMTQLHLSDYGTFYAVYPHRNPPIKTKLFIEILREIVGQQTPIWETRIPGFHNMYGSET